MESILRKVLLLGIWYGIFVFVTNEINPMVWGTFAKVLAVLVAFLIVNGDKLKG